MNLAYVCREVSPITGGGIGTYIANVAKMMVSRGHRVTVITDFLGETPRDLELFGEVRFVQPKEFDEERLGDFMCEHQAYAFRVYETLLDLNKQESFDVIEFPEFRGEGFACIRAKRTLNAFENTRLIVKCHTPVSLIREINDDYFYQPRHEMDIFMEDYSALHADLVTSPSKSLRDYFSQRLHRTDIRICPYPLELPQLETEREPITSHLKTIRYLGSIQPRKGVDHFIDAAIQVLEKDSSFAFEIIGGERNQSVLWKSYSDMLRSRIPERYLPNFTFTGVIRGDEIPALLAKTSVCVLPSRWENWANICLEAMSMGCIVCASSEGGMSEMIQHRKDGFLIDPKDPGQTAELLLSIPHMRERKLKTMSNRAMKRASELSNPQTVGDRIEKNYAAPLSHSSWVLAGGESAQPLVSVIIPYFNQQKTVLETVGSVKASTYGNIEIIVVNDGSDAPEAIEIFNGLQGVVKVEKPNGGLSSARNCGIANAKGEYFMPLDADDTLQPDYIEKAVECLLNHPELDYVGCHARNFGAFDGNYTPIGFVKSLMAFQNPDIKCCALFRKKSTLPQYDELMYSYEDWDFLISIHEQGGAGEVIPESLFNYRRHYGSMVFSTANHQKSHLLQYMLNKHAAFWKEDFPKMSRMLVRLWSEELFERNFRNIELVQVYYGVEGVFSEQHSSILTVYRGQWQNLNFRLPSIGRITALRIDPCAIPGLIRVRRIQVVNTITREPVLVCSDETSFAKIRIDGTATGGWEEDSLRIHSTGNDPQIHVEGLLGTVEKLDLEIELLVNSPE